ncbi:MAG: hypothetical protein A2V98_04540 [Planctomycetes bacterium RBG_16_64_12]|nr:MAG: hypothetical protein A2V98_04540 [Planctomycetes bacterium RBG_16_64_12]
MLTAKQVLDEYFLDTRCMLLEIAATLDRHESAAKREGAAAGAADLRLEKLYQSLGILANHAAGPNRAEQILTLFSDPPEG